jgi:pilus assembly protein CpaE
MPTPQEPFRIFTISSDKKIFDLVKTALKNEADYFFIDHQNSDDDLMECIEEFAPNCILLDYHNSIVPAVDLIDSISLQFPHIMILVLLSGTDLAEANRVMLAGARGFLAQPFTQAELLSALSRVRELHQRSHRLKLTENVAELPAAARGTFVVFSPKGGVGCSTVAINLAIALKEKLQQELLLMDGKLLFGDLDIMLNLKTPNSIADLVPHMGSLDEGLVRDVISEHVSGIRVLPAPIKPIAAQGIHPEDLHRLLTFVQNLYPNIVIDAGNFLNENAVTCMDACQRIILVINPDIASLRNASRFFEICHTTLSFPKEKILLVLNQHDQREGISREDVERALQVKVFATLPWDPQISLQSINRGVPVTMQGQNTPLRKAFKSMAENLAGMIGFNGSNNSSKAKNALPEILSKSSRLG